MLSKCFITPSSVIPAVMLNPNPHNKVVRMKLWQVLNDIFDGDELSFLAASEREISELVTMPTVNDTVGSIIEDWANIKLHQLYPFLH